jgi:hypothetical protein
MDLAILPGRRWRILAKFDHWSDEISITKTYTPGISCAPSYRTLRDPLADISQQYLAIRLRSKPFPEQSAFPRN